MMKMRARVLLGLLCVAAFARADETIKGAVTVKGAVSLSSPARASVAARTGTPIGTTAGTTPEAGGRVYAMPLPVPNDVTTLNVRVGNRTDTTGEGTFTGNVAVYKSDGTGKPTGSAFAAFTGVSISGTGTMTSIGPFNSIVPGSDGKVVVLIGMPNGTTPAIQSNLMFGYYVANTTTVSPNPGGWIQSSSPVLFVDLDYSTKWRRFVVLGDSISIGYSTAGTTTFEHTAFQLIAAEKNVSMDTKGVAGFGSLANFAAFGTNTFLWDEEKWSGNPDVLINLGTNDISGQNLATMETNLQTIIAHVQSLTTGKIYASTIPPQAAFADPGNVRTGFNTYLKANYVSLGLSGVRDRAASQATGGLADNSTQTTLYSAFDAGDGTHLDDVGNTQEKTGWEAVICSATGATC